MLKNQAIGNILKLEPMKNGLRFELDNAWLEILCYGGKMIRVKAWKKTRNYSFFSYAPVAKPEGVLDWQDKGREILITTKRFKVIISKNPARLRFETLDGMVINEDDAAFGISWLGNEVANYKSLQDKERFVGLGEKTGNLDRRGSAFVNWNTDHFAYPSDADPLYLSTPFYMGLHHGLAYGIFFDNSHRATFNFGASNNRFSSFSSIEGPMDYYFIFTGDVPGIVQEYSRLTGHMPLPPKWALGYQQCRYSYYPDIEILNIARTFREKDIPCDVIYLDIHYMDQYQVFTFDPVKFPDPAAMVDELKKFGFHLTVIIDPGIKVQTGYAYYDEGIKQGLFIKYPDGTDYAADVWPGTCHFPDFTKAETRDWWAKSFETYTSKGIDGFWNDMNEPANWGQQMPDLIEFNFDGEGATHRKARNVYGLNMARSTYEGSRELLKNQRPFVLTRSGYSGIQRYAAVWTGDNISSDESMLTGVRLVNSLGLTGVPFSGSDVGGFAGNASPELFSRWMAIGAFTPFYRGHSMVNTNSAEPWAFGEEVEEISRNYIRLRYKLMPYIYSLFYEASISGTPVTRSLVWDFPHDDMIYDTAFQNQFLFGPSMLIIPAESYRQIIRLYLPEGIWYDFYTDTKYAGNQVIHADCPKEKLPVFIRGGAIIPATNAGQHTADFPEKCLRLHLYAGVEPSSFVYYDDDGLSHDADHGVFYKRNIRFDAEKQEISLSKVEGSYTSPLKHIRLYFHGFNPSGAVVHVNGKAHPVSNRDHRFTEPISNFDPLGNPHGENDLIVQLPSVQILNDPEQITITW